MDEFSFGVCYQSVPVNFDWLYMTYDWLFPLSPNALLLFQSKSDKYFFKKTPYSLRKMKTFMYIHRDKQMIWEKADCLNLNMWSTMSYPLRSGSCNDPTQTKPVGIHFGFVWLLLFYWWLLFELLFARSLICISIPAFSK